jgi:hypothetical protein
MSDSVCFLSLDWLYAFGADSEELEEESMLRRRCEGAIVTGTKKKDDRLAVATSLGGAKTLGLWY